MQLEHTRILARMYVLHNITTMAHSSSSQRVHHSACRPAALLTCVVHEGLGNTQVWVGAYLPNGSADRLRSLRAFRSGPLRLHAHWWSMWDHCRWRFLRTIHCAHIRNDLRR